MFEYYSTKLFKSYTTLGIRTKSHLALIAANILFALNYSYSKSIIPDFMTPQALSLARVMAASLLLGVLIPFFRHQKIDRKDIWRMIAASLLGIAGNQFIFMQGLNHTTPIDAAIIATISPVLVLIVSATFLHERITLMKSIGILLGATGAITVILYGKEAGLGDGNLKGNLLVLTSATIYSCYLVVVKGLMAKYSPITVMTWLFGISTLVMFPPLIGELVSTDFAAIPAPIWGAIAFVLIGTTFMAFTLIAYGIKTVRATTVSIYVYSQPIIASAVAVARDQDTIQGVKVLAALLVFAGVTLVSQSYRFEKGYKR